VRRNADGYQMFFLNTVAVAPNKFRPSSKMGDMRCALRPSAQPRCCGASISDPQGSLLHRMLQTR